MKKVMLSENQINLIAHCLGVNAYHAKKSIKKKEKKLPGTFYRNRFNAGEDHEDFTALQELVELGLMEKKSYHGIEGFVFHVGESGVKAFIDNWEDYVNNKRVFLSNDGVKAEAFASGNFVTIAISDKGEAFVNISCSPEEATELTKAIVTAVAKIQYK